MKLQCGSPLNERFISRNNEEQRLLKLKSAAGIKHITFAIYLVELRTVLC